MNEGLALAYVALFGVLSMVSCYVWLDVVSRKWTGSNKFANSYGFGILLAHFVYFILAGIVSGCGSNVLWWIYLSVAGFVLTLFFCRAGTWR